GVPVESIADGFKVALASAVITAVQSLSSSTVVMTTLRRGTPMNLSRISISLSHWRQSSAVQVDIGLFSISLYLFMLSSCLLCSTCVINLSFVDWLATTSISLKNSSQRIAQRPPSPAMKPSLVMTLTPFKYLLVLSCPRAMEIAISVDDRQANRNDHRRHAISLLWPMHIIFSSTEAA